MTRLSTLWQEGTARAVALASGPIARASVLSLAIRLVGLGLVFLQAVLTARLLGASGYGTVASIVSVAQVSAVVAVFGLGPMAVREIPSRKAGGERAEIGGFLRLSLGVTCVLSLVVAALCALLFIPQLAENLPSAEGLLFGSLLVVPLALIALLRGWAQGFDRIASAQVPAEILRPALMVTVMLAALSGAFAFGAGVYLALALATGCLAVIVSFALLWRSDLRALPRPFVQPAFRNTATSALPFLGLGLAAILQGELNTLLLAFLAGPEETGIFQPAARVAPLLALPVQAAGMRYAPRIAELWRTGERDRMLSITRTFTWTTTLVSGLIGLTLGATGPWLMLFFGEEFARTAPLLWIIAAAYFLNAAGGPLGVIFAMAGRPGTAVIGQLAGLAVNVAIGVAFIPTYGAWAAVFGMLAATVTWNLLLIALMRRQLGIDPSLFGLISTPRETSST